MKKFLFAIATALTLASVQAQNATYFTSTLIPTGTATVGNGATLSPTNKVVAVNKAETVGIYCSFTLNGNKTNSPTVKFSKSVDGTNFETTPSITLAAVTLSGVSGTAVKTFDAVDVTGVHSIRLESVLNGASDQSITNLVVAVGVKNLP